MSHDGAQRIVSFLPAATEMVYALGLGDQLAGVTHECDYPPEAQHKQVIVRSVLPDGLTQREIDEAVSARLEQGQSLYEADAEALTRIAPDLIITQELCSVCAPSGNEISQVLKVLPNKPQILWLTPKNLDGIFDDLRDIGNATGRAAKAESLIVELRQQLEVIRGQRPLTVLVHAFSAWSGWIRFIAPVIGCRKWSGVRAVTMLSGVRAANRCVSHGATCWNMRRRSSSSRHADSILKGQCARQKKCFRPFRAGVTFPRSVRHASLPWTPMLILRDQVHASSTAHGCSHI